MRAFQNLKAFLANGTQTVTLIPNYIWRKNLMRLYILNVEKLKSCVLALSL